MYFRKDVRPAPEDQRKTVCGFDDPYLEIVAALDRIPWQLAESVTRIKVQDRKNLNFCPGQRGFSGLEFPIGGVMIVANNFTNLQGWAKYCASPDVESTTSTWRRMRIMLGASGLPMNRHRVRLSYATFPCRNLG
jgi:hypothetical protein